MFFDSLFLFLLRLLVVVVAVVLDGGLLIIVIVINLGVALGLLAWSPFPKFHKFVSQLPSLTVKLFVCELWQITENSQYGVGEDYLQHDQDEKWTCLKNCGSLCV